MSETAVDTEIPGEVEARAREMGWRPKEEWEGDDSGWMDFEPFIERQDKRRAVADPEIKAENEKLISDLASLRRDHAETKETLESFKGWRDKMEERAYKKALKDLQAQQRTAVEAGDTVAFDAAAGEIEGLVDEAQKPAEKRRVNPDDIPAYKDWMKDNGWYNKNYRLTAYANQIAPMISQRENLYSESSEYYDRIGEEVRKEFPEAFENPKRQRAGVEESGGSKSGKTKASADLPADAKKEGARFVKEGLFKNLDEYAKDYFAEEEV